MKIKITFLIYFTENFWKYTLNYFNKAKQENIPKCFELRETFKKYYKLVKKIFEKTPKEDKQYCIYKDAKNYYERDEFSFLLDQIIRKCNENPEVKPIEQLRFITLYNPYYIEPKYLQSKVDVGIFDTFDLDQIDDEFIGNFRKNNFEIIFQEYKNEYIKKFVDKIKNIKNLDTVIKLININNLKEKSIFLAPLNKSYDIISKESSSNGEEAYHIIAKLAIINYVAYNETKVKDSETKGKKNNKKKEGTSEATEKRFEKDKRFYFINKRIKEMDKEIGRLVFIEIIKIIIKSFIKDKDDNEEEKKEDQDNERPENDSMEDEYKDIDFKDLKEYIFLEFSNNLEDKSDIDNIMKLIDSLKIKDKKKEDNINAENKGKDKIVNEFLTELISKQLFTKEEFFSFDKNLKTQNLKILLLCTLYEKEIIQKDGGEYYDKIKDLLDNINKDIGGEIKKSTLDEFLANQEPIIKQRLSLINKIIETFDPNKIYNDLKKADDKINKDLNQLQKIKDNIIIYHKESCKGIIDEISEIIRNNKNKKIKDYKGGGDLIQKKRKTK